MTSGAASPAHGRGMTGAHPAGADAPRSRAQVWLARGAFAAVALAALSLVAFAIMDALWLLVTAALGVMLVVASAWWFLTRRGLQRWVALALVVVVPVVLVVLFIVGHLLWVALLALGLLLLAAAAAREALARDRVPASMPEHVVPPPVRAFIVMNPRSGGGKVGRFNLKEQAEHLGATVVLLEGPGTVDVEALARDAVAAGADLLGVAGGDGTQALVAGVAAEHGLPFLVISAGTRNHFALDLGLDREDPQTCLEALTDDAVELHIDLGLVAGRTFVNNASFG
ncbi:MAG: diacylglycerol/lipid kinase family protein, partial [Oryzihumus sp.]